MRTTLVPVIVFGLLLIGYCSTQLTKSIHHEVESGLKNVAQTAEYMYETMYPGDYFLEAETEVLYKGDKKLDYASKIFESLKLITGSEITIFYKDMRVMTTICDGEGRPIVGTKANYVIVEDVLKGEEEHFYTKSKINGENYFAYYSPIFDSQHTCIGMVFAGKESRYVSKLVWEGLFPIIMIGILAVLAIIVIMCWYSNRLTESMQKLQNFLEKVEGGNFKTELSASVAKRKDELGAIGKSAVQMQRSLRDLVERDSLTGLYNRHYGEIWLEEMRRKSEESQNPYFVAIADIDHFKKFNDLYGHDCGDIVLKRVSGVLKERTAWRGYAARWGGEEFLLIFSHENLETASEYLDRIREEISKLEVRYGGQKLGVTVTIGMTQGDVTKESSELVKSADAVLYEGKEKGRNRLVCSD